MSQGAGYDSMVLLPDQTDGIRNLVFVNACMAILGFFAEVGQNLIDWGCCCKPKGKTDEAQSQEAETDHTVSHSETQPQLTDALTGKTETFVTEKASSKPPVTKRFSEMSGKTAECNFRKNAPMFLTLVLACVELCLGAWNFFENTSELADRIRSIEMAALGLEELESGVDA